MQLREIHVEAIADIQQIIDSTRSSSSESFQRCAVYFALAARKGGTIFIDNGRAVIICKHPHSTNDLLIFPEMGGDCNFCLTTELLREIVRCGKNVTFGRFTHGQFERLLLAISKFHDFDATVFEDATMDWLYPVRIVSTNTVSLLKGGEFQKVRNKCRLAERRVRSMPLAQSDEVNCLRYVFGKWKIRMRERQSLSLEGVQDYFDSIENILTKCPFSLKGMVFKNEMDNPCGMTLWREASKETANLYVNIADTTIAGLSDFQLVTTCRYLSMRGVAFLNLGGSEQQSLDKYKMKFLPLESVEMLSVRIRERCQ